MRILVLGAAGRTGRAVVEHALARGHGVTAFVRRDPGDLAAGAARATGDATDPEALATAVAGHDAVIDTIGGTTPYRAVTLERDVAAATIAAMQREGVRRLLVTSSLGVGDSLAASPLVLKVLVATFLRGSTRDKAALERLVVASDLDWTIARPAVLTDAPAVGGDPVVGSANHRRANRIARADLAAWLVAQADDTAYLHATVTLATS